MRDYKKKSECPPPLCEIIEMVNLLPQGAQEIFNKICDERVTYENEKGEVIKDSAKEILDGKLVDFIFDRETVTNSVERFDDLMKAKTLFEHFARINKKLANPGENVVDWSSLKSDGQKQFNFLINFF